MSAIWFASTCLVHWEWWCFLSYPSSTGRWLFVRLGNLGDSWRNASRKTRGVVRSQVFFFIFFQWWNHNDVSRNTLLGDLQLRFGQLEKEWEVVVHRPEIRGSAFFAAELRGERWHFFHQNQYGWHVGWNDDLQIFILGYVWCSLLLRCGFRVHSVDLSRVLWFEFSCVAKELNAN